MGLGLMQTRPMLEIVGKPDKVLSFSAIASRPGQRWVRPKSFKALRERIRIPVVFTEPCFV